MSGNVDTEVGAKPAMEAQHYRNEGIKMRMKNPAVLIPAAMVAIKGMAAAAREGGIDEVTLPCPPAGEPGQRLWCLCRLWDSLFAED